ncbi:hypothetical protein T4B_3097 [Trichinella pseudospiralis]|uniref:Uncharacterized protein n=1 Tax=Trichinella pseudospiralis TaxID=6337 RepID=A0A0V1IHA2_TRIPS|nr:hypothetical protein T4B_3097 [Trichinella pseudospiralis]
MKSEHDGVGENEEREKWRQKRQQSYRLTVLLRRQCLLRFHWTALTRRKMKGKKSNGSATALQQVEMSHDEKQQIADKLATKPVTVTVLDARAAQAIKLSYIPSGCAEELYLERLQIRIVYFPQQQHQEQQQQQQQQQQQEQQQ